jgi:hypothetical protein
MFREDGMSMYWSEDYIFSVPEPPAILSWHFAMMNAAVRHNGQPIRYYVMPHAPGQPAGMLRRNMLFAAGNGAAQIDNFWIGPQEYFTENYVAWQYTDSFKALHDSIYETAAVEDVVLDGVLRPAKVALVISKATQVNEDTVKVPKEHDPFAGASANAPREVGQTMSRKEQQALYLALRDLGVDVDLITEDDIYKRNVLPQYGVVFFAGEWVDTDVIPALTEWVRTGGTLFASAGLGHLNQYNQPESRMLALLGLAESPITKKLFYERTLLELPLVKPISTVKIGDATAPMVGWSQALKLMAGEGAKVVATWVDGSAAVTERTLGKGRAIAVGGLPGVSRLKTGLKAIPWARGGTYGLYHPSGFDPALTSLIQSAVVRLGDEVSTLKISAQGVEGRVIDSPKGSLLTLVNWHLDPATDVRVAIKLPKKPVSATRISDGKALSFTWVDDTATLKLDLADADYVLFK